MDFSFCQRFFWLLFYSHSMLRQLPENKHLLFLRLECLLQKELCSQPAFSVDPTPPWFRYFFSYLLHIPCGLSRKMDPLCYRSADTRLIPPVPLPAYKAVPGLVFFLTSLFTLMRKALTPLHNSRYSFFCFFLNGRFFHLI